MSLRLHRPHAHSAISSFMHASIHSSVRVSYSASLSTLQPLHQVVHIMARLATRIPTLPRLTTHTPHLFFSPPNMNPLISDNYHLVSPAAPSYICKAPPPPAQYLTLELNHPCNLPLPESRTHFGTRWSTTLPSLPSPPTGYLQPTLPPLPALVPPQRAYVPRLAKLTPVLALRHRPRRPQAHTSRAHSPTAHQLILPCICTPS